MYSGSTDVHENSRRLPTNGTTGSRRHIPASRSPTALLRHEPEGTSSTSSSPISFLRFRTTLVCIIPMLLLGGILTAYLQRNPLPTRSVTEDWQRQRRDVYVRPRHAVINLGPNDSFVILMKTVYSMCQKNEGHHSPPNDIGQTRHDRRQSRRGPRIANAEPRS